MSVAWAHATGDHADYDFGWSFEPWVLLPLLATALLYYTGIGQFNKRGKAGRRIKTALFWTGLVSMALALMSPLHTYGTHIFTAHMVEHEILMVIAVPLMVAAQPGPILLWGMPPALKEFTVRLIQNKSMQRFWGGATELWSATVLHAVVLWLWHLPNLFQAAVKSEAMHILQHLSFVLSALLFWFAVMDRDRRHYEQGLAALALFFTSLQAGLLGAILTFSSRLWYPNAPDPFPISGLTRYEDQSLAGLIMWVPACTIYVIAALILLARWFLRLEVRHG